MDLLPLAAKKLRAGRRAQTEAMDFARRAAIQAIEGGATEVAVAQALNVNRLTVRKWVGK